MLYQTATIKPEASPALSNEVPAQELSKESEVPAVEPSLFETQEIQAILKNRAQCLRAGFPASHPIIATFDEIRAAYIKRVGLQKYLNKMLGSVADVPAERGAFFQVNQRQRPIDLAGADHQSIRHLVQKYTRRRPLHLKVEVYPAEANGQVEVRYL